MHKQNRLLQVMLPSLASAVSVIIFGGVVLTAATFYYLSGSGLIYNFLFGNNSSVELQSQSRSTIVSFSNTVFGNPTLNKILYFAFWMLIGLLVYFLLYIVIKGTSSAVEEIEESKYTNASTKELTNQIIYRLLIRVVLIVSWIIYWILFIKSVLPFCVTATRVGAANLPSWNGISYMLLAGLLFALSLHVHIIFMRLISLRVRLLNSSDVAA